MTFDLEGLDGSVSPPIRSRDDAANSRGIRQNCYGGDVIAQARCNLTRVHHFARCSESSGSSSERFWR